LERHRQRLQAEKDGVLIQTAIKQIPLLVKFLASGFPALVLAVVLNGVLVEKAKLPIAAAYAIVLVMQTTINFFLCRYWVFNAAGGRKLASSFTLFAAGILVIRFLDWMVYNFLVSQIGLYFLVAQGLNVLVFALVKFEFSRRLFAVKRSLQSVSKESNTNTGYGNQRK
jgi:putative flippase GtrA